MGTKNHDEDSDDALLNAMGKAVASQVCRAKFIGKDGKTKTCTRRKGHWGKHKQ